MRMRLQKFPVWVLVNLIRSLGSQDPWWKPDTGTVRFIAASGSSSLASAQLHHCGCTTTTTSSSSLRYTERDRLIVTPAQQHTHPHPHPHTHPHSHQARQRRQVRLHVNSPSSDQSVTTPVGQRSLPAMKTLSSFISEHPEELAGADSADHPAQSGTSAAASASNGQQTTKWKSLRAVMAYYCSLRRIKRNVATPTTIYSPFQPTTQPPPKKKKIVFSVPVYCVLAFC
ncbi:uncharacterized protein [Drosophila takahashii]|uniref:uncharacterized protein n=1 Tax=Drosophila takahashii TaxID=29030 RepID=UPI0038990130